VRHEGRSDTRRSIFRLAVAAVIVGLAIPLLPLFGGWRSAGVGLLAGTPDAIPDPLRPQVVGQRLGGGGRDLVLEARPGRSRGRCVPGGGARSGHRARWGGARNRTSPRSMADRRGVGTRDRGSDPSDGRGIAGDLGHQRGPDKGIAAARVWVAERVGPSASVEGQLARAADGRAAHVGRPGVRARMRATENQPATTPPTVTATPAARASSTVAGARADGDTWKLPSSRAAVATGGPPPLPRSGSGRKQQGGDCSRHVAETSCHLREKREHRAKEQKQEH
jgi:hypothetical protein